MVDKQKILFNIKLSMNSKVDLYIKSGCGRCKYFDTPQCKVNDWRNELVILRKIVLSCGLTEELKWNQPCYTYDGKNILLVTAFKEYAAVAFFKGTLLKDKKKLLVAPGKNSQAVRQFRFADVNEIKKLEKDIISYIKEAIELEDAGKKIAFKKQPVQELPEELLNAFEENKALEKAFKTLTPGRQRGYVLHFTAPKQSATRKNRIEKCIPQILAGLGLHDGYKTK